MTALSEGRLSNGHFENAIHAWGFGGGAGRPGGVRFSRRGGFNTQYAPGYNERAKSIKIGDPVSRAIKWKRGMRP